MPLALYIGVTGLALRMQGIEILFQSLFRGFPGVNRACENLRSFGTGLRTSVLPRRVPGWKRGIALRHRLAGISREFRRGPDAFLFPDGARLMPKKANPFQLVPVMALATAESDL